MSGVENGSRENDPALRDRVQRLLMFLSELVTARSAPVRDLDEHRGVVPLDTGNISVGLSADAASGDIVLRARRVYVEEPPRPPAELAKFVQGEIDDSSAEPTLDPKAPDEADAWLGEWRGWAAVDRERRPAADLYNFLQRAVLDLEDQPESLELVVASGLLQLSPEVAGERVRTHLITQSTVIERHADTGDLLVRLNANAGPSLEDGQVLTGLDVFDPSSARTLRESLSTQVASPVDPAARVFLKEWADRALTVRVEVVDREEDSSSPGATLTPSTSLVLRKRGGYALIEYYNRMIDATIDPSSPVPLGLAQLVEAIEPADRVEWLDRTGMSSALLARDPLFPLPANEEQRDIIHRLADDSGVVVEGPPGTGKTHTIANLVSTLLASGQRVLVTSEKSQALRVLRDKLPPELQELCVSITDVGRGGSSELDRSVTEIATRKAQFNKQRATQRIEDLAGQRNNALTRRSMLMERIRHAREQETVAHREVVAGYKGTVSSIARKVRTLEPRYGWLPLPLRTPAPTLTVDELHALVSLHQQSNVERARRRQQAFPALTLPSQREVENACNSVAQTPRGENADFSGPLRILDGAAPDVLARIQHLCEELQGALQDAQRLDPQFRHVADLVLAGQIQHLWGKTAEFDALVQAAQEADRFVGPKSVDIPVKNRRAFEAYDALAAKLEAGGTWRTGFSRFRRSDEQSAVEAFGEVATVDGVTATTAPTVRIVAEHLRALDAVRVVRIVLRDLGLNIDLDDTRSRAVGTLASINRDRGIVDNLVQRARDVEEALHVVNPAAPRITTIDQARAIADSARTISAAGTAEAGKAWLESIAMYVRGEIAGGASPEGRALARAFHDADFAGINTALDAWDRAVGEQRAELELVALHERLTDSAPGLAQAIAHDPMNPEWPSRLTSIADAWDWRRAEEWVLLYQERTDDRQLGRDLDAVETDIARLTAQLAAEKAWSECLERTTVQQVQALHSYRDHVASIGKGTGRWAERYRAAAREAMQVAQGAVPAWVMPLQQVLASIPAEQNSFDVVIVDEASQADIGSLFLLWLAPRVIVVGDDNQCAPSEVSLGALDGVFSRLDSYLPDIPKYLRDSFTPRSSVFSLLRSRFGSVVRLREHFRSMPEIIAWSSEQFYADAPLVPLRQFGSDRLPPLRTTFVENATVTGQNSTLTNRAEARALADTLVDCLHDDRYAGKTFGVVVLQGQAQVDAIQNELLDRVAPDEWEARRLRVGTPPDFQGDERNVVFLSMVVGPDQNIAAMTRTEYQRRFNVAASRAQDQLWLFHSRTVESLRATDLRHSLLTYMTSTAPRPAAPMPAGVTRDERHPAFDSLFEQEVFLDIAARGYHVNPKVEVNGYFIDLVVTGSAGKLAVACDRDQWHANQDQQRAELERERELTRSGWRFWRVRESEYYFDRAVATDGLWGELERRGIEPQVVDVSTRKSLWKPIELVDDSSYVDEGAEWADRYRTQRAAEPSGDAGAQSNTLADSIVAALGNESSPLTDLASRLGLDWTVVLPVLEGLVEAGTVEEIAIQGERTEYRLADM